jgi:cell division protein FtsB
MPESFTKSSSTRPESEPGRAGVAPSADPRAVSRVRRAGAWLTRWTLRLGLAGVLAFGLGYLPLQFFGERGLSQYRRLAQERRELEKRNQQLAEEIRQMRLEVRRLRDDDVALEKAARNDLGMVRPGELIFVLKE